MNYFSGISTTFYRPIYVHFFPLFEVHLQVLGLLSCRFVLLLRDPVFHLILGRFPSHVLPSTCSKKPSGPDNGANYWLRVSDPRFERFYQQIPHRHQNIEYSRNKGLTRDTMSVRILRDLNNIQLYKTTEHYYYSLLFIQHHIITIRNRWEKMRVHWIYVVKP